MITIGLLGYGTVGHASYAILEEEKESISKALGQDFQVKKILVTDAKKYRNEEAFNKMTTDVQEIVQDPEIDVIIELTGSVDDMIDPIKEALSTKKHLVTANKAMVSAYLRELTDLAKENDVAFLYEAAVGGAIPILKTLKHIAITNEISAIEGVLNGTCNFILSKMEEGMEYSAALSEAQELGFAEADPSADVEGYDTMRKIHILANIGFKKNISVDNIYREGITNLKHEDLQEAENKNQCIKLIAKATQQNDHITISVQPTPVDANSVLGGLKDGENAIIVHGSNSGPLIFKGFGAGGRPTAYAVLADLLTIYDNHNTLTPN